MKTIRTLVLGIVLISLKAEAQYNFCFSGGIGFTSVNKIAGDTISDSRGGLGIHLTPRLNCPLGGRSSVSLSLPLSFGLSEMAYMGTGSMKGYFDLPIAVELNLGHKANDDTENAVGAFIGTGIAHTNISNVYDFFSYNLYLGWRFSENRSAEARSFEMRINFGNGFGKDSDLAKWGLAVFYIL